MRSILNKTTQQYVLDDLKNIVYEIFIILQMLIYIYFMV